MNIQSLNFLCGGQLADDLDEHLLEVSRYPIAPRSWQATLCDALELQQVSGTGERVRVDASSLPVGQAIHHEHDADYPQDQQYLRADPVHLLPDRDSAILVPAEHLALDEGEVQQLLQDINAFLSEDGLVLYAPANTRWYLGGDALASLLRPAPAECAYRDLGDAAAIVSPTDAAAARRLTTLSSELEMLLFSHPVNEARQARGAPVVSSLYLWGHLEPLQHVGPAPAVCLLGDDPWIRYLSALTGLPVLVAESYEDLPSTDARSASDDDTTLFVLESDERRHWLCGDREAALKARAQFESRWLLPAERALQQGAIQTLARRWDEGQCDVFAIRSESTLRTLWQQIRQRLFG